MFFSFGVWAPDIWRRKKTNIAALSCASYVCRAAREGLSVTMMERLVKLYGSEITTMLTMQYRWRQCAWVDTRKARFLLTHDLVLYFSVTIVTDLFLHAIHRMHTSIMAWPSHVLYESQLEAHSSVAEHLLRLAMSHNIYCSTYNGGIEILCVTINHVCLTLASFPAPTQLSVACSMKKHSHVGRAWEWG